MCGGDFTARLGQPGHPGFLDAQSRLARLRPGVNPYVTGTALPGNSPVFAGRKAALHQILSVLRAPAKPGCVSLLGERRIGKSSLLNQVYEALGKEPGLVAIHATAQNWNQNSQKQFYTGLHRAVAEALGLADLAAVADYPGLRNFIDGLVREHNHRLVLILDEFESLAGNPNFDTDFFYNLRTLGERPEYRFGFLLSSRRPLKELCRDHDKIEASGFWNIFGTRPVLGLLGEQEAEWLAVEPFAAALGADKRAAAETFWRNDAQRLTGRHPALIQMAMSSYCNAVDGEYPLDALEIPMTLRDYLEDFWYGRGKEELAVLLRCAAGRIPEQPGYVFADLVQRGLITPVGEPFCGFFRQVISESLPKGKTLVQAAEDFEKGAERLAKLFEQMVKVAEAGGKIYTALKGSNGGKETGA